MCEFKKGDKVICINTDNHPELIKNKIYEVEKPNGDFVYLKGCKYGYFTFLFRKECKCYSKDYAIRISVDKWNKEDKKWETENNFDVDYCPMCGRKLAEDGRKGENKLNSSEQN